jgi:hypothetical protein
VSIEPLALTDLLVLEVGETPDLRLAANVGTYWTLNAAYGAIYAPLQRWYTKLNLIDLALGYYRAQVNTTVPGGVSLQYQQRVQSLLAMRADTLTMVTTLQQQAQSSRGGAQAPITQTQPELPPPLAPVPATFPYANANDPIWQGDPYEPQGNIRDVAAQTP